MKRPLQIIFALNIFFELAFPLVGFWYLGHADFSLAQFFLPGSALAIVLALSGLLSYALFAPAMVRVNRRRFPRVTARAVQVFLIPLVLEVGLGLLAGLNYESWLFVAGIHFYTSLLLITLVESLQTVRVRAFHYPFFLWMVFLFSSGIAVVLFQLIVLPVYLAEAQGPWFVLLLAAWFGVLLTTVLAKFFQGGRRLYAKRGYRPNAAVIVTDGEGMVLLCERADRPGTVQTVQGGIDPGETPRRAAQRELSEELGIWPDQYQFIGAMSEPKRYDWEPDVQKKLSYTGYKGQEQYFFLVQADPDVTFDLDFHHREFRKVWWDKPERLLQLAWSKKRPGIEAALKGFKLI